MKNQNFLLFANSNEIILKNCIVSDGVFSDSSFFYFFSILSLIFNGFYLKNNSISHSQIIYGENLNLSYFRNIIYEKNVLNSSKFFEFICGNLNFIQKLLNIEGFSNYFHNNSVFLSIKTYYNQDGISLIVKQIHFYNNYFEDKIIQIFSLSRKDVINLSDILLMNNIILDNICYIIAYFYETWPLKIEISKIIVSSSNYHFLELFDFYDNQQKFLEFIGVFDLVVLFSIFIQNICFIGPCGFAFESEYFSLISFKYSIFLNNLAVYWQDIDNYIAARLILFEGDMSASLENVIMNNNFFQNLDDSNNSFPVERGDPCVYADYSKISLLIANSSFKNNSGLEGSYYVFFNGITLEVKDSFFENSKGGYYSKFYIFFIDSENMEFNNAVFINCKSGVISIYTMREIISFYGKNLTISNNMAFSFLLDFAMNKFKIMLEFIVVMNNSFLDSGSILTLYSLGDLPEEQSCIIQDSYFFNNTSFKTIIQSSFIFFNTIGHMIFFSRCFFVNNYAISEETYGGIVNIYSEYNAYTYFVFCIFWNNSASFAAIAYNLLGCLIFKNCYFEGNDARNSESILLN